MKEVFSRFVDVTEGLRKRRFTALHSAVLNLTTLDLEQLLCISTADIESRCSMGRTPLLWAISTCNIGEVKTLVKFGANLETCDNYGHSAFHRVTARLSGGNPEILNILIRSHLDDQPELMMASSMGTFPEDQTTNSLKNLLNRQDFEGSTPLLFAAMNNFTKQVRLLITYGAESYIPGISPSQPILQAIYNNCHSTMEELLRWKVNLDVIDRNDGDGLLHHVSKHGDLKTISLLMTLPPCCIDIGAENNEGYKPLRAFDEQRHLHIKDEVEQDHRESREAFLGVLASVRPPSPDHNCWRNGWDVMERNESENLQNSEDDDERDEFFDAVWVDEVSQVLEMPVGPVA